MLEKLGFRALQIGFKLLSDSLGSGKPNGEFWPIEEFLPEGFDLLEALVLDKSRVASVHFRDGVWISLLIADHIRHVWYAHGNGVEFIGNAFAQWDLRVSNHWRSRDFRIHPAGVECRSRYLRPPGGADSGKTKRLLGEP